MKKDNIEMLGKKAANKTIVVACYGANIAVGAIETVAAIGEFACWGIRSGAEMAGNKTWEVIENGGVFRIDEDKQKEKTETILQQY